MLNKKTFDYKWVIVITCCLMVFISLGFCSSANSMYIKPITEALCITRGTYSVTTSIRFITASIINVFFGTLIYRYGAKKLILSGFISLIISTVIYSIANNVLVFYLGSIFLGAGLSFTTTTMVGSVVNKWCAKNKGTVMGIALASNGIGAMVARLILTPIIYPENNNIFAYRNSYRIVALILLAFTFIVLLLFKDNPKDQEGDTRYEKKAKKKGGSNAFLKRPYFYAALVCIFMTGLVLQSVSQIADPHLRDNNVDLAFITTVMSLHSIVLSGSKFFTGLIYDKAGLRISSAICYIAAVIAMLCLAFVGNSTTGVACSFIYSVLSSVALPLETIMLPIFAREFVEEDCFNKVLGIFVSINTAGYALGGPLANFVFDFTGSYDIWIFVCVGLIAAIFLSMNLVITKSKRFLKAQQTEVETVAAN